MAKYVLTRVRQSVITLILVSIVVFAGIRALPGDPALALAGEERSPAALAAIRAEYGLDDNIVDPVRALHRPRTAPATWAPPRAPASRSPTPSAQALPVTLELAALSLLLAIVLGIGAGVVAAVRRGRPAEWIANGLALLGLSIPTFWLGIVLVLAFAIAVPVFAASGFVPFGADPIDNLRRMVLPAIVLGSGLAAVVMRQTRAAMLDSLSADYVRTARAKGLSRREVVGGHALRNSLVTVVTVLGLQLGHLISGAVVTEQIFVLPGFGKLTIDAVFTRDYATLQGVVLCTSAAYILINLLVDVGVLGHRPAHPARRCPVTTLALTGIRVRAAKQRQAARPAQEQARHDRRRHRRGLRARRAVRPARRPVRPRAAELRQRARARPAGATGSAPTTSGATSSPASSTGPGPRCRWACSPSCSPSSSASPSDCSPATTASSPTAWSRASPTRCSRSPSWSWPSVSPPSSARPSPTRPSRSASRRSRPSSASPARRPCGSSTSTTSPRPSPTAEGTAPSCSATSCPTRPRRSSSRPPSASPPRSSARPCSASSASASSRPSRPSA